MSIYIKPMESDDEIRGKAYVHWKAWQEAYAGIVDQAYLDAFTLEKCTNIAFRWTDNLLVAKDGQKVVGFAGYALMSAAIEKLSGYKKIAVWVLEGNRRAIKFYERYGFRFDGTRKPIMLGTENTEIRMLLNIDNV